MIVKEVAGILIAVLVLAGLTVAIVNGGDTARVLSAAGNSFANVVRAATLQ